MPFSPVVFRFRFLDQLIEIERWIDRGDGQTVRFSDVVSVIGGDQRRRTGHVLHDDVGITRDMLGPIFRQQARIEIVDIAGFGADEDADRLPLVERCLRGDDRTPHEHGQ
jgi:hypothetical protein